MTYEEVLREMDRNKTVTKSGTPIKLLLGGSPCKKWSIAQKNGREVLPEGIGWELRVKLMHFIKPQTFTML